MAKIRILVDIASIFDIAEQEICELKEEIIYNATQRDEKVENTKRLREKEDCLEILA